MNSNHDDDTLRVDENLTLILSEIYQWQNLVEQNLKGIHSELKQNQVLLTHLLEESKRVSDRIHALKKG